MTVRLFVAIEPPEAVREEARRAAAHLRHALPTLRARYPDPSSTHLTLVFLGHVEETHLAAIERAMAGAGRTTRVISSRTAGLGAFPTARRPSVLWLGIEDAEGGLAGLQRALAGALAPFSGHEERKGFVPHLTLARVSGVGPADRAGVQQALESFRPALTPWPVREVVLFESELRREGARYRALARHPLSIPP